MALTLKIFSRADGAARFMGRHELEGERVTIGRSVECTLQLPDPERKLSRVHVEFLGTGDGYRLKVASAHSSVVVNGRDYPPGSEVTLRVGDALSMDVYDLDIVSVGASHPEPMQAAPVDAPAMHREEVAVAPPAALLQPARSGARLWKRLGIGAAVIAVVVASLVLWPQQQGQVTDLTHSVQQGGLHFKGTYKGEPFELVRTSAKSGKGSWDLNLGPPTDRIRATAKDGKGLTEIQAPDTGYRMTFDTVEGKRLETRLYQGAQGFVSGSVLYRVKGRWMHGMMKSEQFTGYADLVAVTDFTEKIERPNLSQGSPAGTRAFSFAAFELISSARAQNQLPAPPGNDVEPDDFDQAKPVGPGVLAGVMTAFKDVQSAAKQKKDQFIDKARKGVSEALAIVDEVRDTLHKLTTLKDLEQFAETGTPAPTAPRARTNEPAPGLGSATNIGHTIVNIVRIPIVLYDMVRGTPTGRGDPPATAEQARDTTPPPVPNAGSSSTEGLSKFEVAANQARTCIYTGNLACAAERAIEARSYLPPAHFYEPRPELDQLRVIEHNLYDAQMEVKRKAYEKEEAARRALQAEDRKSAEIEAEAKRIATQPSPGTPNVAMPKARPQEAEDPDIARSSEFIEAQEKRRLKAQFDRIELLDKAAAEEDKDKQAALRRRYDALTKAEAEEQADLRRRFERASEGQSAPRPVPVTTASSASASAAAAAAAAPRPAPAASGATSGRNAGATRETKKIQLSSGKLVPVSNKLLPSDGVGEVCGKKLFFANGLGGYRMYKCDGTGEEKNDCPRGKNIATFEWGFLLDSSDPAKLVIKPFSAYGWGPNNESKTARMLVRFKVNPDCRGDEEIEAIIGVSGGKVIQGTGYGYSSQ